MASDQEERLAAYFRVAAITRQAELDGNAAYIRHKGDKAAGAILLKLTRRSEAGEWQARLRSQSYDMEGKASWLCPHQAEFLSESDSEAWISRAIARDRDLWVIEIEENG